ncbi:MAG: B12-binding domain-containing radical SAM protein [Myxococcota bacterium]
MGRDVAVNADGSGNAVKRRVLIVNVYFPEVRAPIKRSNEVPNALAPVLLAGHFDPAHCEVTLYNEVNSGHIEVYAPKLLEGQDLVVLTGLTAAFDRLLHVTAYVKTANPRAIVVAGGHGVRALPRFAQPFFDYTCLGDVDEIRDVIREALGSDYVAREWRPRYDLAYWMKRIGYAESSRNCNFRCSFCSLTGVGLPYRVNAPDYLEAQLEAMGKRRAVFFNDNQLLGDGRRTFSERLERVQERRLRGQFEAWGGFVTDTFFWDEDNIRLAHETGCVSLFVGVESFLDTEWLDGVNKPQNARESQVELIRRCLDGGVLFQYGLVFDPTKRTVEEMTRELDVICDTPEIPLPLFIFTSIPFPGTPLFHDLVREGRLLPGTRVRDLESSTLTVRPLDGIDDVVGFIRRGKNFRGYRRRVFDHQRAFLARYRDSLSWDQKFVSNLGMGAILFPGNFSSPKSLFVRKRERTHVSTTERLDEVYSPRLPVAARYRSYFEPTALIDANGELNPKLAEDALDTRFENPERVGKTPPLPFATSAAV